MKNKLLKAIVIGIAILAIGASTAFAAPPIERISHDNGGSKIVKVTHDKAPKEIHNKKINKNNNKAPKEIHNKKINKNNNKAPKKIQNKKINKNNHKAPKASPIVVIKL